MEKICCRLIAANDNRITMAFALADVQPCGISRNICNRRKGLRFDLHIINNAQALRYINNRCWRFYRIDFVNREIASGYNNLVVR